MEHQVTLNIPDAVYQRAHQIAERQGVKLENVLVGILRAYWSPTNEKHRQCLHPRLERRGFDTEDYDNTPTEQNLSSHWVLIILRLASSEGVHPQSNISMNALEFSISDSRVQFSSIPTRVRDLVDSVLS
ncbi:hypothetical protein F4Y59_02245 [Candidatus Poribacteria bacterium]|nr:hypothetical protein [Candidatus Poribacteria bacterium]MYK20043.1 hypothetical protein [Candidatus Poribacteria bacterium]